MHPSVARTLIEELSRPGGDVLDPFCGSGTVAVEALIARRPSLNADLNPFALRLARCKAELRDARRRVRFGEATRRVTAASSARVLERVPITASLRGEHVQLYAPHVLKELAGLLCEIRRITPLDDRRALEQVFSAIVVKFSRKRSETSDRTSATRLRKGLVTEFFARKADELIDRWAALSAAAGPRAPIPRFVLSDARRLPQTLGGEYAAHLIVTSPPYGGTYDYAAHHALRADWLGIGDSDLWEHELGARRTLSAAAPARATTQWDQEVDDVLAAMAALMEVDAVACLVVGDARVGGRDVEADAQLERLSAHHPLRVVAVTSQMREDWQGGRPRHEHIVALLRLPDEHKRRPPGHRRARA